jgi:hypothetical protein
MGREGKGREKEIMLKNCIAMPLEKLFSLFAGGINKSLCTQLIFPWCSGKPHVVQLNSGVICFSASYAN